MADIEKRIVKVCLSLAAVIILFAAFSLQTSAESYTFTDSNGISWSYKMSTYEGDSCAEITGCGSIPESGEITVPGYINGLQVIVGDNALNGVSGLIKATVSEGAIGLKGAFRGCDKLESVDLPSSLIFIDQLAFSQCTSLSSVDLKEGLKMIRGYAFGKCFSLTSVSIPSTVEVLEPLAFYECTSLSSIIIDGSNNSYKDIDGVLFNKDGDTLILYPLGRSDASYSIPDGVINIGNDAFARSQLEEITIPAYVKDLGNSAFQKSVNLKNVNIENGLEVIGSYVFANCTSLCSIKLPQTVNFVGSHCFEYCEALRSVKLPDALTDIKSGTFKKTIIDQNFTIPPGVKCIEPQAFEYCYNLTHLLIPDNVERIDERAFAYCKNLKDIYLASGSVVFEKEVFLSCGPYDTETGKRLFAICADQGSTAAEYARSAGIPFVSMTQEAYEAAIDADTPVYDPSDDPADDPSGGNSGTGGNEEPGSNGGNGDSGTGGNTTSGTSAGSSGKTVMTGTAAVPAAEKVKKTGKLGKPKFKAKNKKGRKVKLSWSKVKDADGYMIYVKGPKDKKFRRRVTKSARVKSITHKGLVKGKKYKYKIAAYKVVKGVKKRGPFSKTITVKIRK